jgi:hypothetical protein
MGVRAFLKDILIIYLGYEIVKGYITHNFTISASIFIIALVLIIFAIWFFLERLGILPKVT